MLGKAVGKVVWAGRATVFLVGLAVILALMFGAATTAMGADGRPFLLGKRNVASAISTLVKQGTGPALKLQVGPGQPPLAVNSSARVASLNAASAGRADSAARADTAADADKLAGEDWEPEAWHNVGFPGEPAFGKGGADNDCFWGNFGDGQHNLAGFYKDQTGTVHLKGLVKVADGTGGQCDAIDDDPQIPDANLTIFRLPAGYLPARRNVHVAISGEQLGRVDVDPDGTVSAGVATPNTVANAKAWLSLDGITFRAED